MKVGVAGATAAVFADDPAATFERAQHASSSSDGFVAVSRSVMSAGTAPDATTASVGGGLLVRSSRKLLVALSTVVGDEVADVSCAVSSGMSAAVGAEMMRDIGPRAIECAG